MVVHTVLTNSSSNTLPSQLTTIDHCSTPLEPTAIYLEDYGVYPTANQGIQKVRNKGERYKKDMHHDQYTEQNHNMPITIIIQLGRTPITITFIRPTVCTLHDFSGLCLGKQNSWGSLSWHHHHYHTYIWTPCDLFRYPIYIQAHKIPVPPVLSVPPPLAPVQLIETLSGPDS